MSAPDIKSEWKRSDITALVVLCAIAGVVFYKPFVYMVGEWITYFHSSYSPGPFVPLVSGYIIWLKRDTIKTIPKSSSVWGVFVAIFALIMHLLAQRGDLQRVSITAFIILTIGIVLYMAGKKMAMELLFPLCFLIFMVPMEFLDGMIGVKLRLIASTMAGFALELLGFNIIRIGTQIEMVGIFKFDVAAPCSGLKSLVSLTALTFAFSYLTQKKNWKRIVMIAFAFPIAIFANVFRIIILGLIATAFGGEAALGFFHGFSGFFLFTFALLAMTGIGRVLSWIGKKPQL
ncbi:MAG: exosortase/archaeosortase family protein [Candidatus Auribacterota bacterium]|jgi:exosortase|nr:exosortase/archaeosortase family protein [Candidatus Auribacterota bacterium]